jgi:hypothetical protein
MASRDRFEVEMKCPKCGAVGVAQVSENDYPFMGNPGFNVDVVPDGFTITRTANIRARTEAVHNPCKIPFYL